MLVSCPMCCIARFALKVIYSAINVCSRIEGAAFVGVYTICEKCKFMFCMPLEQKCKFCWAMCILTLAFFCVGNISYVYILKHALLLQVQI